MNLYKWPVPYTQEELDKFNKEIAELLASNDNSIPIVCMPPGAYDPESRVNVIPLMGHPHRSQLEHIKTEVRLRILHRLGYYTELRMVGEDGRWAGRTTFFTKAEWDVFIKNAVRHYKVRK